MANRIDLLLEAEKRGILPESKKPLLEEARKRGLIKSEDSAQYLTQPKQSSFFDRFKEVAKRATGFVTPGKAPEMLAEAEPVTAGLTALKKGKEPILTPSLYGFQTLGEKSKQAFQKSLERAAERPSKFPTAKGLSLGTLSLVGEFAPFTPAEFSMIAQEAFTGPIAKTDSAAAEAIANKILQTPRELMSRRVPKSLGKEALEKTGKEQILGKTKDAIYNKAVVGVNRLQAEKDKLIDKFPGTISTGKIKSSLDGLIQSLGESKVFDTQIRQLNKLKNKISEYPEVMGIADANKIKQTIGGLLNDKDFLTSLSTKEGTKKGLTIILSAFKNEIETAVPGISHLNKAQQFLIRVKKSLEKVGSAEGKNVTAALLGDIEDVLLGYTARGLQFLKPRIAGTRGIGLLESTSNILSRNMGE